MATKALGSKSKATSERLNILHIALAGLSAILALLIVGRRINLMPTSCNWTCQEMTSAWYSPLFEIGAIAFSGVSLYFLFSRATIAHKATSMVQGACAIAAFAIMLAQGGLCTLCLALQFTWFATGLAAFLTRFWSVIPALFGALAIYALVGETSDNVRYALKPRPGFVFREHEPMTMKGGLAAYAIFTDPLCPACRSAAKEFYAQPTDIPYIYRWKPLTQHGDAAVRYCAALESALSQNFERGMEMVKLFYLADSADDKALVESGVKAGFARQDVQDWLANPDPASLLAIQKDTEYARLTDTTKVPSIRAVSTVGSQEPKIRSDSESRSGWEARFEYEKRNLKPFGAFLGPQATDTK